MSSPILDDSAFAEPEAPWRPGRWLIFSTIVFCLLVAVAAHPAYRWGKTWRARALAAEAETLTKEKKWSQAANKVQAAYELAPNDPATLRAFARLYSQAGVATACDFWMKLLALPQATVTDRIEAVRFALVCNRLDFAEQQIAALSKAAPSQSETLELAVQLALQKNDRGTALEALESLLAANPAHPAAPLLKAQLLFSAPEPGEHAKGMRELQELAKGESAASLTALRILASRSDLSLEEIPSITAALTSHPQATTDDRLNALSLQIRLTPAKREELIDQAIRDFASGGPDALVALGRWTNRLKEYGRVIQFISLPASLAHKDLFLVRLDALAALAQWSELQRILSDEKVPLEETYRQVFLARSARELGEPRGAEARWGAALRAAGQSPEALLFVAQYAEKVSANEIAEEAYRQLARQPNWTLRADTALVPLLELKGNTRGLRDIINQIAVLVPTDRAPRNDAAYLDLLLKENIPAATETAEKLMRERPDLLAHRTTLALARLRAGNPVGAAELYRGVSISWDSAPPGWQAVYAAVLAANGESQKAAAICAALPDTRLKPEERALIAPLR